MSHKEIPLFLWLLKLSWPGVSVIMRPGSLRGFSRKLCTIFHCDGELSGTYLGDPTNLTILDTFSSQFFKNLCLSCVYMT